MYDMKYDLLTVLLGVFIALSAGAAQVDFNAAQKEQNFGGTLVAPPKQEVVVPEKPVETGKPLFELRPFFSANHTKALSDCYLHNRLAVGYVGPASWLERGEKGEISRATVDYLPANVPFYLPIVGTRAEAVAVRDVLDSVTNALSSEVREVLCTKNALAPILQWLIRRNLAGLEPEDYLTPRAHPAAFMRSHFDFPKLEKAARELTIAGVPPIAYIRPIYDDYARDPRPKMKPGRDYSDHQDEESFATPFAIGIVLRAPEANRVFRFSARTWGGGNQKVEYKWMVVRGRGLQHLQSYLGDKRLSPANGFAEIHINRRFMSTRLDIAVFSRIGKGLWGPPAIISFYQPPDVKSDYYNSGLLRENNYASHVSPTDPFRRALRPLYAPRDWADTFDFDTHGNISVISRRRAGSVFADRFYRPTGEKIIELWPSGQPKRTIRVTFFMNKDGMLDYVDEGAEIHYPYKQTRGEHLLKSPERIESIL